MYYMCIKSSIENSLFVGFESVDLLTKLLEVILTRNVQFGVVIFQYVTNFLFDQRTS